jgi:hypothetical protein
MALAAVAGPSEAAETHLIWAVTAQRQEALLEAATASGGKNALTGRGNPSHTGLKTAD